jgi:hypothetical protein
MTSIGATAKTLPLPIFDGEPTKFKGWWMRFKAYATIEKISLAIQRTKEADLPDREDEDVTSDNKKLAKQRNLMAISCLTMAFQDDALLNILEQSETAKWPSGLVYVVVDEVFKKYKPVDIISRVSMRTRLSQVKMKAEDDPRILFNQLASIQSAYNDATRKIDPDDLTAVVLEKAPEKYKSILTAEQRHKGTGLTLSDLNRTMNPNTKAATKAENEVSLVAPSFKFKGVCNYCKKPVHLARDCRKKLPSTGNNEGKSTYTLRPCRHCGGQHMDSKCWELSKNASRRPKN